MKESTLCKVAPYCKDYLNLQLSSALKESPDKDLMDQFYELCTHPSEEAKECFCGNYKIIKKSFVEGAEEILRNWHPEQAGYDPLKMEDLRMTSRDNKKVRKRGIKTWQR